MLLTLTSSQLVGDNFYNYFNSYPDSASVLLFSPLFLVIYIYISRALSPYCNLITFLLILVDFQHIMNVNFLSSKIWILTLLTFFYSLFSAYFRIKVTTLPVRLQWYTSHHHTLPYIIYYQYFTPNSSSEITTKQAPECDRVVSRFRNFYIIFVFCLIQNGY